jgi:hypothetical protein
MAAVAPRIAQHICGQGMSFDVDARRFHTGLSMNAVLSSLAAFLAAGARPPTPLAKAIVLVLVVKLMAIAAIGVFLFSSRGPMVVDSTRISRLIGPSVPLPNEGGH